jgi:heme exporter protein D
MNHPAVLAPSATPATAQDVVERLRARSRATGALVMTAFGALWAGLGAAATGAAPLVWTAVALLVVALALPAVQLLRANPAVGEPLPADVAERLRRAGRIFTWTCIGEGVGILLAINLVVNLGHPQWQAAAIMGVVGLHFLPLAVGFGYRPHWVTGAALTGWALAYPWLFAAGATAPAGPLVGGAMLFASAAWALRSATAARR